MTALWVVLGIIGFFALISLIRISVNISYIGDLRIVAGAGFLKFEILKIEPGKKEKEPPENIPEHIPEKQKKKKKEKKKKVKGPVDKLGALKIAFEYLKKLMKKTGKYLYCKKFIVKCNVASDDAAQTAQLYGLISGQAANLTAAVLKLKHSKKEGAIYCEIKPDFLSGVFDVCAEVQLGLKVYQIVHLAFIGLIAYLKINKCRKPVPAPGEEIKEKSTEKTEENK